MSTRNSVRAACALVLISATAIAPTAAFAKKGDLYQNSDGSCDAGDSKSGYWCVESIPFIPGSMTNETGSAKRKGITRTYQSGAAANLPQNTEPSTKMGDKPGALVNRPENPLP